MASGCCCKEVYRYPHNNWTLWVWIVGVVSRKWVWLVGVVVRRYIDILTIIINFPYFFDHFKNLFILFCTIYSKCYSKNSRDHSKKMRSREYNY